MRPLIVIFSTILAIAISAASAFAEESKSVDFNVSIATSMRWIHTVPRTDGSIYIVMLKDNNNIASAYLATAVAETVKTSRGVESLKEWVEVKQKPSFYAGYFNNQPYTVENSSTTEATLGNGIKAQFFQDELLNKSGGKRSVAFVYWASTYNGKELWNYLRISNSFRHVELNPTLPDVQELLSGIK